MVNQFVVLAGIYGLSGSLFVVVRKLHFHHQMKPTGYPPASWGFFKDLSADRSASNDYFEAMGFLLIGESFVLAILSEFVGFSGPWGLALSSCLGTVVFVWVFGFGTKIVDHHGGLMILGKVFDVLVKESPRAILFLLILLWPVFLGFPLVLILGLVPPDQSVYLVGVIGVPIAVDSGYIMLIMSADSIWHPEKDFVCTCSGKPEIRRRR